MNFSTLKVGNFNLALYTLSIRAPQAPYLAVSEATYTFPISPSSVRRSWTSMSAIYDTAGPSESNGVTRLVDSYGSSPLMFEIEGTTGWDLHQTDGFLYTGLQSIHMLGDLFGLYASLNAAQQEANDPNLYTMEFFDFFNQEFWQVEPIGPQEIRQSERAPTLQYYRLRLAGIQSLDNAIASAVLPDPTEALLATAATVVAQTVESNLTSWLGTY